MKYLPFGLIAVLFSLNLSAQSFGTIKGVAYEQDSSNTIPFAKVWIEIEGSFSFAVADIYGRFKIDSLEPGYYLVNAKTPMFKSYVKDSVLVVADSVNKLDIYFESTEVIVCGGWEHYLRPHEYIPEFENKTLKEIDQVLNGLPVLEYDELGQITINGKIQSETVLMVDGIRYSNINALPLMRIRSVHIFNNGLSAKYGDTTSEVVEITTKGYFDLYYEWKVRQ